MRRADHTLHLRAAADRLLPGRPGTSTRSGWRRPGPTTGSPSGSAGTAGPRAGTPGAGGLASASTDARISRAAVSSARLRSLAPATSRSRRHGESSAYQSASAIHMFPMPATSCLVEQDSPSHRGRRRARIRASIASKSGGSREDVRPEPRERARVQLEHGAVPEHRLRPRRRGAPATAARAAARRAAAPSSGRSCAGASGARSRPRSGARGSSRPRSTDSSRRPSRRSRDRSACARGCGVSTSTLLADERLQAPGGAVEGVALGHDSSVPRGPDHGTLRRRS